MNSFKDHDDPPIIQNYGYMNLVLARSELRHLGNCSQICDFGFSMASTMWIWQDSSTAMPVPLCHTALGVRRASPKEKHWEMLCKAIQVSVVFQTNLTYLVGHILHAISFPGLETHCRSASCQIINCASCVLQVAKSLQLLSNSGWLYIHTATNAQCNK